MRVLLIEDHPLVAAGLVAILDSMGAETVVAASLEEARQRLVAETFATWVLDLVLPDGAGSTLLEERHALGCDGVYSMILSATTDLDEIQIAFDAGANAFVSKVASLSELRKAFRLVLDPALRPARPAFWDDATASFVHANQLLSAGTLLSPREQEVYKLARQGMQDKEIAERLDRSINTIRVQMRSIQRKRGRRRRADREW